MRERLAAQPVKSWDVQGSGWHESGASQHPDEETRGVKTGGCLANTGTGVMKKPGRNHPCPCGSGKKFKHCCLSLAASDQANRTNNVPDLGAVSQAIRDAITYHRAGDLAQAEAIYRQVLEFDPENPDALHLLGLIAHYAGHFQRAANLIRRSVRARPSGPVYYNLAVSLQAAGETNEAVACYRQALQLMPADARVYANLGVALQQQGQHEAAVECYRQSLSSDSSGEGVHGNLGVALLELGRLTEAAESFREALRRKPDDIEAHKNFGHILHLQGNYDAAIQHFRDVLEIRPDYARVYDQLLYLYAQQALLDPADYLSAARSWEQACIPAEERRTAACRTITRSVRGRLRVGYVSGDFRQHAVSHFIEKLFTYHDRERVELFAYSNNSRRDAITERLQGLADHWVPLVGMSDATARDRIERDGIDILVDLSGHTDHNRLGVFARRAAPVQAHYLGFFASTGLSEMDYWIGDDALTPPETHKHFSEQVWRLPRVWVSYDARSDAPPPAWRPANDGAVRIGSFNHLSKLTAETVKLWASVLHALPEACLLLKTRELADSGNRRRILEALSGLGIPANRIELLDSSLTPGWREHMAYYDHLDIALDPVGGAVGGTTTCDALWMGVPVICREGGRMASRMTSSMLKAIGQTEWIASSDSEYIDKVVSLARNPGHRAEWRRGLREQMARSALCDARGLAVCLEEAYAEMFDRRRTRAQVVVSN